MTLTREGGVMRTEGASCNCGVPSSHLETCIEGRKKTEYFTALSPIQ